MSNLQIGRTFTRSYGPGSFVIIGVTGPCTCPNYLDSISSNLADRQRRSEEHHHITAEQVGEPGRTLWFNGYRPDGTSVWGKDVLTFGELATGMTGDLFGM